MFRSQFLVPIWTLFTRSYLCLSRFLRLNRFPPDKVRFQMAVQSLTLNSIRSEGLAAQYSFVPESTPSGKTRGHFCFATEQDAAIAGRRKSRD